jgi:hypothetical protein
MTETLPSPLDYFSDEEVPFSDEPDTFAYIAFDFSNMTFILNIKQNGDDEYLGGDDEDNPDWSRKQASEESVESFIKEVKDAYGVEKFPESLEKKALDFIRKRQYTESFDVPVRNASTSKPNSASGIIKALYFPDVPVRNPSISNPKGSPDMIKVLYFRGFPSMYSGYLSVERGDKSFAGLLEDREMLTGAVIVLNDALQDATETDAIAKIFCLLADIGREVPGGEETYRWGGLLIPYAHPRPRLVEELLLGDGEMKPPHLPRVPDRRA